MLAFSSKHHCALVRPHRIASMAVDSYSYFYFWGCGCLDRPLMLQHYAKSDTKILLKFVFSCLTPKLLVDISIHLLMLRKPCILVLFHNQ